MLFYCFRPVFLWMCMVSLATCTLSHVQIHIKWLAWSKFNYFNHAGIHDELVSQKTLKQLWKSWNCAKNAHND